MLEVQKYLKSGKNGVEMLEVQKYLKSGKTLEELKSELGIKYTIHNSLSLVILNYDQIESPKIHPIVRECRGLTLRNDNFDLVCRSFNRFFNWGEVADEMSLFNFNDFVVETKEDGSLVTLYYFDGSWHANTRGSFAQDTMQGLNFTWTEGFCRALGISSLKELNLDTEYTYVCEFCSPYNKVVRKYNSAVMYLLTVFKGEQELTWSQIDSIPIGPLLRVQRHPFKSVEEIQAYLQDQGANDPTFEGVVIRDTANRRWKIKSPTYLGLHRLKGEGDNLFHPKHLLPFILSGEEDELLTYYEEAKEVYFDYKSQVLEGYVSLLETWIEYRDIESQKDFAIAIDKKTPFKSLLFTIRKKFGKEQTVQAVKQVWRDSSDLILKVVFGR